MYTATNNDDTVATRKPAPVPKGKRAQNKIGKTMSEFATGDLHSGSKDGPAVTSRKQAVAIALSQARKAASK